MKDQTEHQMLLQDERLLMIEIQTTAKQLKQLNDDLLEVKAKLIKYKHLRVV